MAVIYDLTDGVYHYIGQTIKPPRLREAEHKSRVLNRTGRFRKVHQKMDEVGPNLFNLVVLERCRRKDLNKLEDQTITEYRERYGEEYVLNVNKPQHSQAAGRSRSKLTEADVAKIRKAYLTAKYTIPALSKYYGVNDLTKVVRNLRWYSAEYQKELDLYDERWRNQTRPKGSHTYDG